MRKLLIICTLSLSGLCVRAQFHSYGEDASRHKWFSIKTPHNEIIFTEGNDSTARLYGEFLEKYRTDVSKVSGFAPRRQPVILHPENASAGFLTATAPTQTDVPVLPQGRWSVSYPLPEISAIHGLQKTANIQFGRENVFRPLSWFLGDIMPLAAKALYPDSWMLEGSAVMSANELVPGGYGRYGEFLNYYMAAFDAGDVRGYRWDRWMIGSPKHYTPDDASFGFLILSGLKNVYGNDHYLKDFLSYYSRRPYDIFVGSAVNRKVSGDKFKTVLFRNIIDYHRTRYNQDILSRHPFSPYSDITAKPKGYTEYTSAAILPDRVIFAVKSGHGISPVLVRIDSSGRERSVSSFDGQSSRLVYSECHDRLFWSELRDDIRWKQKRINVIKYMNPENGMKRTLVSKGNYFNPCISPDGRLIAAVCGPAAGTTKISVIDPLSGKVVRELPVAPEGVTFNECAWSPEGIFASGVSNAGMAIYLYENESWTTIYGPLRQTIKNIVPSAGGELAFLCDKSGVFDLYALDEGKAGKLISTKYGAKDFVYNPYDKSFIYSRYDYLGHHLSRTADSCLFRIPASLLTTETASEPQSRKETARQGDNAVAENFSAPERYRKGFHLLRFHSWAPVYFDLDKIEKMSGSDIFEYAGIGAVVLTQNPLGTASGSAGYTFKPSPDRSGWLHGGHLDFTYSGWYPVIKGSFHINERIPYSFSISPSGNVVVKKLPGPHLSGNVDIYLPLSRNNSGRSFGIIPKLSVGLDNALFNGRLNYTTLFSTRLYWIKDKAEAEIYPEYGIGVEFGTFAGIPSDFNFHTDIKLNDTHYFHTYGYFPGILPDQGGKITATGHLKFNGNIYNPAMEMLPRGFKGYVIAPSFNPLRLYSFTLDYAVPVWLGDINISQLVYLNRLVITPHFDYMTARNPEMDIYSAGASLTLNFGRLIWAFNFEVGVDYSYNGSIRGGAAELLGFTPPKHRFSPVVKIGF